MTHTCLEILLKSSGRVVVPNVSIKRTFAIGSHEVVPKKAGKWQPVWSNIIWILLLHAAALYGLYLATFYSSWITLIYTEVLIITSGWGVTAGAHRLWAHRSFKASKPLRLILLLFFTIAGQVQFATFSLFSMFSYWLVMNHVIHWVRDHRVHHKFSETDADPYNSRRGLFFSHMGWLMIRKHPDVVRQGQKIDVSDLTSDPLLQFHKRYYMPLMLLFNYILPGFIACYFWQEDPWVAFFVCSPMRYCWVLHTTWTVNSIAHKYGNRPYDERIQPTESTLSTIMALGEGWHNFHHTFPFDYRASEWNWTLNLTTAFLDICALFGMATDLKTATDDMIISRKLKTGENRETG